MNGHNKRIKSDSAIYAGVKRQVVGATIAEYER